MIKALATMPEAKFHLKDKHDRRRESTTEGCSLTPHAHSLAYVLNCTNTNIQKTDRQTHTYTYT